MINMSTRTPNRPQAPAIKNAPTRGVSCSRVTDGTRTRDVLDHNQVLYQLNYGHQHVWTNTFVDAPHKI